MEELLIVSGIAGVWSIMVYVGYIPAMASCVWSCSNPFHYESETGGRM